MNATAAAQHEALVLGAGCAGLSAPSQLAARARKRGNLRVTLVNPYDTFTERPPGRSGRHRLVRRSHFAGGGHV